MHVLAPRISALLGKCALISCGLLGGCVAPARDARDPAAPAPPTRLRAVALSAALRDTCAVVEDGSVLCWGNGCHGATPDGLFDLVCSWPKPIPGFVRVRSFAPGHLLEPDCALTRDGAVWCGAPHEAQRQLPLRRAHAIAHAGDFACAIVDEGALACWSFRPPATRLDEQEIGGQTTPVTLRIPGRVTQLSARTGRACAVDQRGAVYCFTARAKIADELRPAPLPPSRIIALGAQHDYVDLGLSNFPYEWNAPTARGEGGHACALGFDGSVQCFGGANKWGERGSFEPSARPGFVSFALGLEHSCALDGVGVAYCWGINGVGQLGDGAAGHTRSKPEPVRSGARFVELAAGYNHTCGRTAAGEVHCWGSNKDGELGLGSQTPASDLPRALWAFSD